jgi:hypothetical protein
MGVYQAKLTFAGAKMLLFLYFFRHTGSSDEYGTERSNTDIAILSNSASSPYYIIVSSNERRALT